MKKCKKCGVEKNKEDFSKCQANKDGLRRECRRCDHVRSSEYHKKYLNTPRGRFLRCKNSAKHKNILFNLTEEEFSSLFGLPCFYCGKKSKENNHNGIDRVDSSEGYILNNCVSCCWKCNDLKSDNNLENLINIQKRIKKIIKVLKK